ncbi:MAG: hypothetical protein QW068_04760 [Thermoplasmata archaeon]
MKLYVPVLPFRGYMEFNVVEDSRATNTLKVFIDEKLIINTMKENKKLNLPVYTAHIYNDIPRKIIGTITDILIATHKDSFNSEIILELDINNSELKSLFKDKKYNIKDLVASVEINDYTITGVALNHKDLITPMYHNAYALKNLNDYHNIKVKEELVNGALYVASTILKEEKNMTFEDVKEFIKKYNIDPIQLYGEDLFDIEINNDKISIKSKYPTVEYSLSKKIESLQNDRNILQSMIKEKEDLLAQYKKEIKKYKVPEIKKFIEDKIYKNGNEVLKKVYEQEKDVLDILMTNLIESKYDESNENSLNVILEDISSTLHKLGTKYEQAQQNSKNDNLLQSEKNYF